MFTEIERNEICQVSRFRLHDLNSTLELKSDIIKIYGETSELNKEIKILESTIYISINIR